MPSRLDNRPLLSTFDDEELFVAPPGVARVHAAVSRHLNVLVLGAPGAGKTTLLHRLAAELDPEALGLSPRYVDLGPAATAAQALALILEALGQRDFAQAWGDVLRPSLKPSTTLSSELIGLVRRLGEAPPSLILADSPPGEGHSHVLFGRLRDELWQLRHRWVVAVPEVQRDEVTRPPANAFFDVRFELGSLPANARRELLRRRVDGEDRVDIDALAQASDGLPRSLIESAREAVLSDQSTESVIAGRDALETRLGTLPAGAREAFAYLRANGPTSASNRELLGAMGFSAQRARVVLGELEQAGLAKSFAERMERRGRPRKLYEALTAP